MVKNLINKVNRVNYSFKNDLNSQILPILGPKFSRRRNIHKKYLGLGYKPQKRSLRRLNFRAFHYAKHKLQIALCKILGKDIISTKINMFKLLTNRMYARWVKRLVRKRLSFKIGYLVKDQKTILKLKKLREFYKRLIIVFNRARHFKKLKRSRKVVNKRLDIASKTIKRLTFWKFIMKPVVFWFIYYFNVFFIYYFKTLFSLWIRRFILFFNNNINIFFFKVNDFSFDTLLWYFSSEQLIYKSQFFFRNQFYYYNLIYNKIRQAKSRGFNKIPIDIYMHFKPVKFLFCNKNLWIRRYKNAYKCVKLLKPNFFKTFRIGGWKRSMRRVGRKFLKFYARKLYRRRISKRVFKAVWRNRQNSNYLLKLKKWGAMRRIRRTGYFKMFKRRFDRYKSKDKKSPYIISNSFVKVFKIKRFPWKYRKKTNLEIGFANHFGIKTKFEYEMEKKIKKRMLEKKEKEKEIAKTSKKWFNGRFIQVYDSAPEDHAFSKIDAEYYRNKEKSYTTARIIPRSSKSRNYTLEQRYSFSRYKRFKARCGISCSYFEWLKTFENTALEKQCSSSDWKPYGWTVPKHLLKKFIFDLPASPQTPKKPQTLNLNNKSWRVK